MVTLRSIADRCGVDVSTVSKVIHGREIRVGEETRAKILAAAKELNYRPNALARSLRLRRSGAIVMAMRDTSGFVYPEIIDGAQDAAERHGTCLFLLKYSSGEKAGPSLISLVQEGRIDGILWDNMPYKSFSQELIDAQVPFICLNGYADVKGQCITLDDREGFERQANYLADLGHKRIGFIGVEPQSEISILCREAFLSTLKARGIDVPAKHIWHCHFEGDDAIRIVDSIDGADRPTAIASASLMAAKRLCDSLIRKGIRVPEDISIIGYHDGPDAQWNSPPLTTVKMPSRSQGALAVECLLEMVAGGKFHKREVADSSEIIERESCLRYP
ncbi:MAG: LacI family DNA-binding transcriptional regulator [Fimbriimonas sp.]|nr:LacI family DNA-binding transcriptional regulator [Fimbriimonas sp.]